MNKGMKIAFAYYLTIALWMLAFWPVYLSRPEFMSYPAADADMAWAELPPRVEALFLAVQKTLDGACLAPAVVFGVVLIGPFRRRERSARTSPAWAVQVGDGASVRVRAETAGALSVGSPLEIAEVAFTYLACLYVKE